jgi:CPA1 family monovalent cation:H+ antiporter
MHDVITTVFATTTLLGLVSLLLPLASRLAVPYAVLLAVVGIVLGVAVGTASTMADGNHVVGMLQILGSLQLSSESFLYIFLPTLLFETALNVDVRRLVDEIAPVLLMAVLAVVVSTFVVGLALWPASNVGLVACLMLGAILATTDPVAVVAIFRDIGAPRRLSTLVEGESLFNDAAAIALFTLLIGMITGSGDGGAVGGAVGGIVEFLRDFVGGLAFGCTAGWVVCAILPALRGHRLAEVTLTIAAAYLAFVVGDHYVHVSGVVASVSAGLMLSHLGRRRLSPSSWDSLAETWEQLGFWASSFIFLLAAMLVPRMLADARWHDLLLLAILVASAFAARGLTLFGLLPLLTAAGLAERVLNSHKLVILWGGMRGAVSLALALSVTENDAIPPDIRRFVAILATGFVLFTLLVNAPSLRRLMHALKLDVLSPEESALRGRALALARVEVAEGIEALARGQGIEHSLPSDGGAAAREEHQLSPEARAYSGLSILAEHEQELCLHHFESHTVSRRVLADLLNQTSRLRDGIRAAGGTEARCEAYLAAAARGLEFPASFRLARGAQRWFGTETFLSRALSDRLEMLLTLRLVLHDLAAFAEAKVLPLFGEETDRVLHDVLAARLGDVERAIAAIELQYPTYAATLQSQILSLSALRLEEESVRRLHEESILPQEVFNALRRELDRRRHTLAQRPRLDLGLDAADLVGRVPLLHGLSSEGRIAVTRLMRPHLAVPGERVVCKGDRGDGMYFVSSGAVEVQVAKPVRLGSGDFFGELSLLDDIPRNADVDALGFCQLLFLSKRDFDALLQRETALREHIHQTAIGRRIKA